MSSYAEQHLIYKVSNAEVRTFPYPHFYIEDVFPAETYAQMLAHFPAVESMPALKDIRLVGTGYPEERLCVPLTDDELAKLPDAQRTFWTDAAKWLLGGPFLQALMRRFQPWLDERFRGFSEVPFRNEGLLVDDHTRYFLGPHSDKQVKVLTLLFYLPPDRSQEHLGTSIYVPRQAGFRCLGGPHYDYGKFDRMYTAPFRPNVLFGFVKTDNSFHGVEPIRENESSRRQLLLYDVNVPPDYELGKKPPGQGAAIAAPAPAAPEGAGKPKVGFSF